MLLIMGVKYRNSNQLLRILPIVVGVLGGTLLMVNRLLTVELTPSQGRSDVLGVMISAVLILTGLLWQQFQPAPPERVQLIGEEGFELCSDLPDLVKTELAWASQWLLMNTAGRSLVIYYQGKVLLRRGILGPKATVNPGPIVQRVLEKGQPIYLVNLTIYPGKIEFDYLPENTQGVICQPLGDQGVMILGANAPRSYTQQDERWIEAIADKIGETLRQMI